MTKENKKIELIPIWNSTGKHVREYDDSIEDYDNWVIDGFENIDTIYSESFFENGIHFNFWKNHKKSLSYLSLSYLSLYEEKNMIMHFVCVDAHSEAHCYNFMLDTSLKRASLIKLLAQEDEK